MRQASIERNTRETRLAVRLTLEGQGRGEIRTPIGFFTHMLDAFSRHGLFDLAVDAEGDLHVDQHHLLEDCGLVIGSAFREALGDKRGINRAGYFVFPMDEALAVVAVDIGGRPYLQWDAVFQHRLCGELDTDVLPDFFQGFVQGLAANVAVRMPYGRSDHHKIEAVFKAWGKAMKMACDRDPRAISDIPSTKGVIDP